MRNIALAALAFGSLMVLGNAPANAVGIRHPFCIQGDEYPGLSYCMFDSYAQCMASASGRRLTCIANPYFVGESHDPYAYPNRNRRFPRAYIPYPPNPYVPYPRAERPWDTY